MLIEKKVNKPIGENKEFVKMLLALSVPIIFQYLINTVVNLIDIVMVGKLGENSIAAVGLGNQIFFILNLIMLGISSGLAIFMTQYWGKKDIDGLQKSLAFGFTIIIPVMFIATVLPLFIPNVIMKIFTTDNTLIAEGTKYLRMVCFSYMPTAISILLNYALRSIDKVRYSFLTTAIALSLNVILNYFLIFGIWIFPEMGVVGAALATTIARYVQMLLLVGIIYSKKMPIALKSRKSFRISINIVEKLVRTSGFVFLNEMLYGIGSALYFAIYGRMGSQIVAATNIAKTIENFVWIFFWGFSASASVSIGKLIGSEQYEKAKRYAYKFIITGFISGLVLAGVLLLSSRSLLSLFAVSQEVVDVSLQYIKIFSLFIIIRGSLKIVSSGVMRAGGDTKFICLWDIIPLWGTLLVTAILAIYFRAPVSLVFTVVIGYDVIRVLPIYLRIRSGKWINNVVK